MTWSSRHQFFILAAIALIVFVYAGVKIVRIVVQNSVPLCTDQKQNGDETGIDCGGSCQKMCIAEVTPLRIVWERPVMVTDTVAAAVAMIENKNANAGIRTLSYTVKLYDDKGVLSNEPWTGETFIEPNTQAVLFMPPVRTGSSKPATAHFEVNYATDFEKVPAQYNAARLSVMGYEFLNEDTRPLLSAKIANPTGARTNLGSVLALIYDTSGNIIGASQTLLPPLGANSETFVTFTWPRPFASKLGRVEIIPRVNPFQ